MEEFDDERCSQWFKDNFDCKYFVLKAEDLFRALIERSKEDDEDYLLLFDYILEIYNDYRENKGKGINKYFVINRDETNFKTPQEFIDYVRKNNNTEGIQSSKL